MIRELFLRVISFLPNAKAPAMKGHMSFRGTLIEVIIEDMLNCTSIISSLMRITQACSYICNQQ